MTPRNWSSGIPYPAITTIQRGSLKYAYKGIAMLKNPFDIALYMRLLWELKPRTLIEIGSYSGGSAVWFGDLMDNYGIDGRIYSVDIRKIEGAAHPRATFFQTDGGDLGATFSEDLLKALPRPWLVVEDADHFYETTKKVLDFFHPHLAVGDYFAVEDGIIADMGENPQYHGGPLRAIHEFLTAHQDLYVMDVSYCDFFGHNFTWNTNGFLKKIRA